MVSVIVERHDSGMPLPANLHALDADALRQLLIAQDRELNLNFPPSDAMFKLFKAPNDKPFD